MAGVLDLWGVNQTSQILKWLTTWEPRRVQVVQQEMDDLVNDLTMSLKNLYTAVCEVTSIPTKSFSRKSFEEKYVYFVSFYLGDQNISSARTHCGNVKRDVNRIRFKLEKAGFTDFGEWSSVDQYIMEIEDSDELLLCAYDKSLDYLQVKLDRIKVLLEKGEKSKAKDVYKKLKDDLTKDIMQMNKARKVMERAKNYMRKSVG